MQVDDTDLEYNVSDEISLRRYLDPNIETMDQWAQRVWTNCRLQKEEGQFMASVYQCAENQTWQERATEIWENKKRRRREAIGREFKINHRIDQEIIAIESQIEERKLRDIDRNLL